MTPRLRAMAVAIVVLMASGVWLYWDSTSRRDAEKAGVEATRAANESLIEILSYEPGTVEKDLDYARARLTGAFLDEYTTRMKTVVIPDATNRLVSVVAQVPSTAVVSAQPNHVVVLAFVNQTTTVDTERPPKTTIEASSVRVTLERVDDHWLISAFETV